MGGNPARFIMPIEKYAEKLIKRNKDYPWIRDGKFIFSRGSKELIKARQKYFFKESLEDH